jgi:hypothetical protein
MSLLCSDGRSAILLCRSAFDSLAPTIRRQGTRHERVPRYFKVSALGATLQPSQAYWTIPIRLLFVRDR